MAICRSQILFVLFDGFKFKVNLPYSLTCSQCVVQWTYYTGNTWGICANGTEGERVVRWSVG